MTDERDRTAETNNLRAENHRRESALAAAGVTLDRHTVMQLQLRALKAVVVGDDPERQAEYDLAYQRVVAEAFDEIEPKVEQDLARSKLVVPTNGLRAVQ